MDRNYTYFGPMSAVTLAADVDHPGGRNVQLMRGLVVSLPEDNAYVASLVARKYLVPVEGKSTSATTATTAASQTASTATASSGTTATVAKTSTAATTAATTASAATASSATSTGSETKTGA